MSEPVVVVDFGTLTTSAALVGGDREGLLREPGTGGASWPTAVYRDPAGAVTIGSAATARQRAAPDALITWNSPPERNPALIALMLRHAARAAAARAGGPVARLVLTWGVAGLAQERVRRLLLAVGERAGFTEVELLPRSLAAAAGAPGPPVPEGAVVLVYDLGHTACRVALVRRTGPAAYESLGEAGASGCAGRAMDDLVAAHLRAIGGERLAAAVATGHLDPEAARLAALRFDLQLRETARRVRHELSRSLRTVDCVTPAAAAFELGHETLDELVEPLVEEAVDLGLDLLDEHGLEPADLARVVAVGGLVHMPLVRRVLSAGFPMPIRYGESAQLGVLHGAATLVRATPPRLAQPMPRADEQPLTWDVPGARVHRWLVEPGGKFEAGAPLLVVRTPDGALRRLRARDRAGVLVRQHAAPGTVLGDGDWLATVTGGGSSSRGNGARPRRPARDDGPGRLVHHGSRVDFVAFSPDGQRLLTAGGTEHALIWDVATTVRHLTLRVDGEVESVAFAPDGRTAALGGQKAVTVRHTHTGTTVRSLSDQPRATGLAYSPDGTKLAVVATGGSTSLVRADSGERLWRRPVGSGGIWASPDGEWLVVAADEGQAFVCQLRTGTTRSVLGRTAATRHLGWVVAAAFGPDGDVVVTSGIDGRIAAWRLPSAELLWTYADLPTTRGLAFLDGGRHVLAAGFDGVVLDAATGRLVTKATWRETTTAMAATANGELLALAQGDAVRIVPAADLLRGGAR
ncbi:Hsp70 family protein [Dactylosporangium sp. NPDC005572]|uniref:Hsp70 family protein n=1 Tax=Dactylosporangium sp. NPDC005572 TaxID=3156889 RepID=UPI0033BD60A1